MCLLDNQYAPCVAGSKSNSRPGINLIALVQVAQQSRLGLLANSWPQSRGLLLLCERVSAAHQLIQANCETQTSRRHAPTAAWQHFDSQQLSQNTRHILTLVQEQDSLRSILQESQHNPVAHRTCRVSISSNTTLPLASQPRRKPHQRVANSCRKPIRCRIASCQVVRFGEQPESRCQPRSVASEGVKLIDHNDGLNVLEELFDDQSCGDHIASTF